VKKSRLPFVKREMTTLTAAGPVGDVGKSVLDRARRGDQEAFATLIRHYDPGLRALAYRLLGDRDRMDDALQDAYVKAFVALPRFRGGAKVGTWLYRVVYNVCLDELRRARRTAQVSLEEAGELRGSTRDPGDEIAGRGDLVRALAGLTPEDRAAVLLVDAQGFSYDEAGRVLDVPAGTIASRLNRGRAALREALGGITEGAAQR
jgi:RNA polymerase sigma-70 factor (ECF subfamily)